MKHEVEISSLDLTTILQDSWLTDYFIRTVKKQSGSHPDGVTTSEEFEHRILLVPPTTSIRLQVEFLSSDLMEDEELEDEDDEEDEDEC